MYIMRNIIHEPLVKVASSYKPTLFRRCAKDIFRFFNVSLPAIFVSALAGVVFALPNQTLDIYRDIAQTIALGPDPLNPKIYDYFEVWRELIFFLIATMGLSFSLHLATQSFLQRVAFVRRQGICRAASYARTALPIVLGIFPILMIAIGFHNAKVDKTVEVKMASYFEQPFFESLVAKGISVETATTNSKQFVKKISNYNSLLATLSSATLCLAILISIFLIWIRAPAQESWLVKSRLRLKWRSTALFLASIMGLIFAISLLVAYAPTSVANILTPLPTFCLFCVCFLFAMEAISRLSDLTGVPLILIIIIFAGIFSIADLNDNHAVRYKQPIAAVAPEQLPPVASELSIWLSNRDDRLEFEKDQQPYPIYIVAAQGGGAYAAFHAATFLADAQEMCPNFAHHTFAISSVSGGSVGASIFSALMRAAEAQGKVQIPPSGCRKSPENDGPPFLDAAIAALDHDFWSPLQAALLFPDFIQRFLFWPEPNFDRALALERALEDAWATLPNDVTLFDAKSNLAKLMEAPYADHWKMAREGKTERAGYKHSPALLLNTTEVDTGHRRIIAPFQFAGTGTLSFLPLQGQTADGEGGLLPLSTAAILSARFPWITPPAWIEAPSKIGSEKSIVRVADGGYFENSGVATALDLINELHQQLSRVAGKFEITLIILTSADFVPTTLFGLGETVWPIETMLNTRTARASIEIDRAKIQLGRLNTANLQYTIAGARLLGLGYPLPLGWRLSTSSRYLIQFQKGFRLKCPAANHAILDDLNDDPNCTKALIFRQLSHL